MPRPSEADFKNRGLKISKLRPSLSQRANQAGGFIRSLNNIDRQKMKRPLVLLLVALLSGCAGVLVSTNEWKTMLADEAGGTKDVFVGEKRGEFRSGPVFGQTNYPYQKITERWLLERWGKPDGKQEVEKQVVYFYNSGTGLNWGGVIAGAGVMVPLLVPLGKAVYYFTFENGLLRSIRYKEIKQKGGAIGMPVTN